MRFSTPRVSLPFSCVFSRRRPRGSFVRRRLSPTYRARGPGCYRDLAGRRYRPATLMGFRSTLRSFDPIRGRSRAPRRRLRAHLPFRRPHAASFFVAGYAPVPAHAMGLRPRLLGFAIAPADQPYRVIRRPRHGFYAQGRKRTHRPGLPWVFIVLSQVFGVRPPASTSGNHSARASRAATRDIAAAMDVAKRRPCPSALSGAARLAEPRGVSTRPGVPV